MRGFIRLAKKGFTWKSAAKLGGLALGVSLARQQYLISCEEVVFEKQAQLQPSASASSVGSMTKDLQDPNLSYLQSYTSLSELIIHHRTESECIVLLPNCSVKTRDLILSSLSRKRAESAIRIFVFDPSQANQKNDSELSERAKQHEQEKKASLAQKLDNSEFIGINSSGDIRFFSLDLATSSHAPKMDTHYFEKNYKTEFQKAVNFFFPPKTIRESDFPSLVDSISNLPSEERLVVCYIPETNIDLNRPTLSSFDSFKLSNNEKNIPELERQFRELSYSYVEKHTRFVLIRSSEIAHSLSIKEDDIGELFLLKRSSKANNSESNWTFSGKEFVHSKIEMNLNNAVNNPSNAINSHSLNLYSRSLNAVQVINVDTDLRAFLQSQQEFGMKKFLLYFSAEALEQEYEDKVIQKLADIRKNVNDKEFTIIFTKNPALLKKFFAVIPDRNTDTVRFLDFSNKDSPTINSNQEWSIRTDLMVSTNLTAQDESTTVYEKKAGSAKRFKYEGKITRNKLSFFVKQAISADCNTTNPQFDIIQKQIYQETEESILSVPKTQHLNAANFYREILGKDGRETNTDGEEEISIVYFYKPGCPNCTAMGQALEKFQDDLSSVKSDLSLYDSQEKKYMKYDDTLLNRYRLDNHSRFKSVQVYRYNIYNECKEFPSPSAAPLVFIFTKHNRLNPIQADLLKDRVNINDSEKVSRYLFKKVDLLNSL